MSVFPSKVNYATGDILTATDMNEIGQAINLLDGAQFAAGKNTVINGAMDIWQRGTSIAGTTTSFSADRWQSYRGVAGSTFSRQTGPDGIQYCTRVQRDSGNTSTTAIFLSQNFETVNSIPLAGKTVTLSFYARAGANYSRVSNGLSVSVFTGTGTDQNGLTGAYTGSVTAINQTATLTTSWQRFTYSATLANTATEINITFGFTPVGTAGAADYYEITGVQLEAANTASNFQRAAGTIQGELAACQRYYYRITGADQYDILTNLGTAQSTTAALCQLPLKTTMRVSPTSAEYANILLSPDNVSSSVAVTSVTLSVLTPDTVQMTFGVASGLTQFRPYYVHSSLANGYVGVSAEL
jgi:hypothetical protein